MTRVKICGCMRVEDALAAKEAGADFIGLVFAPNSRRRVTIEQAQQIIEALGGALDAPIQHSCAAGGSDDWFRRGAATLEQAIGKAGRPLAVGVFEDQAIDEVNAIAEAAGLDLIQLSGAESWGDCLRAVRPVVKTIELPVSLEATSAGRAIALLLDVSRGRGIAVDREAAAAIATELPVWLAGGLTPENVSGAIREVRPWAVDVSSGVETDGKKDRAKISAFVRVAKAAATTVGERSQ